ncbi:MULTISPECIES: glycosyltransferase family 9 protein [Dictyoglomus]|mgnify:CR=1 FL=1|jgi:putative inorganic carbon (HCO3(-)) transporter|uniref:glycosyltransferase family 9 protein n=1 Tax=Dictyoglomus TaxID=13 RepID=UPI0023551943|nr:glycosyltransferase family 9 protein [Dictyoglomus turgidum]
MDRLMQVWKESLIFKVLNLLEDKIKTKLEPIISTSFFFPFFHLVLEYYLYIFLFLLPFLSSGKIAVGIFIAFILWVVDTFLAKDRKFFESLDTFTLLYILFMLINLVATFFSPYLMPAIKGYLKFCVYFGIFLVFRDVFKNKEKVKRAIFAILFSTFLLSLYCLYQWIIKVPPLAGWEDVEFVGENVTRVYGTLQNPNLLGGYLIGIFPFILSSIFIFRFKSIPLLASLLSFLSIIWTYSRGAYFGFFVSLILYFYFVIHMIWGFANRRQRKILLTFIIALVFLGVGIFLKSSYLQKRIFSIFTLWGHSSNATRIVIWERSFKIFKDFFLTGIGLGNDVFRRVYAFYMEPKFTALASYNLFMEIGIEGGIFALIVFLLMLYYLFSRFIKRYDSWDMEQKLIGITSLSSVVAPIFHGFVDTIWYRPYPQIIFWFSVSILVNLYKDKKESKILLFNLGGLGDQILFLPVIKALKEKLNPKITIITERRGRKIYDLLKMDVIEFNPKENFSLKDTVYLLTKLHRENYDISISTGKSLFIPIFMYLVGAPIRAGYKENPLSFLYTHKASSKRNEYMARVHFRLVEAIFKDASYANPEIELSEGIKEEVERRIREYGLKPFEYTLLHPGVSKMSIKRGIDRRWSEENWVELIKRLKEHNIDYVIIYGPDEEDSIRELKEKVPDGKFVSPKSLEEFLGWIYYSKVMVCLDSAPLHLGVALKKPIVALFGPTNPAEILPIDPIYQVAKIDLPCEPCLWDKRKRVCESLDCMKIPVDLVWEKLMIFVKS